MAPKPGKVAKAIKGAAAEPFEALREQLIKPVGEEAIKEVRGFLDNFPAFGNKPRELAKEDLDREREKRVLVDKDSEDQEVSGGIATEIAAILKEYKSHEALGEKEQRALQERFSELQEEIIKLAESAGIDTKAHLENLTKVGNIDINLLTATVKALNKKVEDAKNADDLQSQRANVKQAIGMLAWVSGKQMKVHEQGTLQLQG